LARHNLNIAQWEPHRAPKLEIAEQIAGDIYIEPEDRAHMTESLEILSGAICAEPILTAAGVQSAISYLHNNLRCYEAIQTDRKRHPEIAAVKVVQPWVVLGVPRGGTTFLHALLAQDPANRSPETWEASYPSPPPSAESFENDPRIARWVAESSQGAGGVFRDTSNADAMKKRLIGAKLPQECGVLMMPVMRDLYIWALVRIMNYTAWYLDADLKPAFSFHKKWLQHMQWRAPRERWVLKSPNHAVNLPYLLNEYPDARIIQTHRSPIAGISSFASLISTYRQTTCRYVDPHSLGMEILLMTQAHTDRPMAYRRANPHQHIIDLSHRELTSDPLGSIRRIYSGFDTELTPIAERRMRAFIEANPQGALGEHKHRLENFGLSEGLVREVLGEYYHEFSAIF
jgi:hypothetical protein